MTDPQAVCRQLEASIPFVLKRISAKAFLERHDLEIRKHAADLKIFDKGVSKSAPTTIIALGKMASSLAFEFVERYELDDVQGVVSAPYESNVPKVRGLDYFEGGHPVPNEASLTAATSAVKLLENLSKQDVVIYLISGGGSACFELPDLKINLTDIQSAYSTLISCGAEIREVNTLRQRLSLVKGGKLAKVSGSVRQLSLIVSDVPNDELKFVSSGPTIASEYSREEIEQIISKHSLEQKLPSSVNQSLAELKMSPNLQSVPGSSICIGSNADAIAAAKDFFCDLGWQCKVDQSFDYQPVDIAVSGLLKSLDAAASSRPCCVIAGGEVVSPVVGAGRGGRNQAFVLECIPKIAGRNIAVMSLGTDGRDGNSPAAGALADSTTFELCKQSGIDPAQIAQESNSYHAFSKLGRTIETGPTQTNVCDLRVLVRFP